MDAIYYIALLLFIVGVPVALVYTAIVLVKPRIAQRHLKLSATPSRKSVLTKGLAGTLGLAVFTIAAQGMTLPDSVKQSVSSQQTTKQLQAVNQPQNTKKENVDKAVEQAPETPKSEVKKEEPAQKSEPKQEKQEPKAVAPTTPPKKSAETQTKQQPSPPKPATPKPASPSTPKPKPTEKPAPTTGTVKLSKNKICHAPGTTYYNRTKNYTPYPSLQSCLNAGGRLPKQ